MVEDNLENLRTAKRLGMKTVWISQVQRAPGYVDMRVAGITGLYSLMRARGAGRSNQAANPY
jgi:putative hydrolase of the HAD superfamily